MSVDLLMSGADAYTPLAEVAAVGDVEAPEIIPILVMFSYGFVSGFMSAVTVDIGC